MKIPQFENAVLFAPVSFRLTAVFALWGASMLLESCCACSAAQCADEFVTVELTDETDDNFAICESLIMRWSADNNSGEVTQSHPRGRKTTFELPGTEEYESGEFIEAGTETLNIELLCNDVALLSGKYEVEWDTFVCNKCSDFAWCNDEMATTGSIFIDVDPTEFSTEQN